ncbi:hypothetical protein BGW38_009613 [Lunasporangiospora selenospora]|uniref:Uncharacterized protein n=1 Tax=Lunasporangiospora selenospora TaxID=979761 RepID=A0A9P6FXU4_9FUNG|nr:hypothetical protein BGW38_009613 [Lunasporangiospora selenospora]
MPAIVNPEAAVPAASSLAPQGLLPQNGALDVLGQRMASNAVDTPISLSDFADEDLLAGIAGFSSASNGGASSSQVPAGANINQTQLLSGSRP